MFRIDTACQKYFFDKGQGLTL